jgi:hypothetical protein
MMMHNINYLAVLVSAVVIFLLGGLWYSPLVLAKRWVALQGKTMEQMKADAAGTSMAGRYAQVFVCGLIVAWVLAMLMHYTHMETPLLGAHLGAICWLGFAAATSYGTALFSSKPRALWAIDTGFNLISMVVAGAILGAWR